jgi:hypothetical protein
VTGYTTIEYLNATLEVQEWLVPLWPDISIDQFPTFCGAGGIGDIFVPDTLYGANISPACFIHDIDFACSVHTRADFVTHNNRLAKNAKALVDVQLTGVERTLATAGVVRYWFFCMAFGWIHFRPEGTNPWSNKTVRERLNRLAKARYL